MNNILNNLNDFNEIKELNLKELDILASDIREFLIDKVSKTGGHLASNLGVVELTISLYNVFDFSQDKLIWDVGHQAYVHKILTGRKEKFETLRKFGGISGFPKREESIYDMFETGHSSTSISAALGMARARDLTNRDHEVIAVIGDGALTGGMALEALNDAGYRKTKLIVILNDNQMSIGKNVGGLSTYLSKLRIDPKYTRFREEFNSTVSKIPSIGKGVTNSIERIKDSIKQLIVPGMLFEDMGIRYFGPIDGHNIKELSKVLTMAKKIKEPVIIHVITKKGKGYNYAENNPDKFHGIGPFDCDSGELCFNSGTSYSTVFGDEMLSLAKDNLNLVAITAAMRDGTGLSKFAEQFPQRFFDVGIAEQHAVTLAAGMAKEGLKPVFAVYSTFLQRAYDQILHDVSIQKLPVIFAIDRAGIVGEDGETHQGIFDLSYLTHIPNMTIVSPKCLEELRFLLRWAVNQNFPVALRYPRGGDNSKVKLLPRKEIDLGSFEVVSKGSEIALIAAGKMVQQAMLAKEKLVAMGYDPMVVSATFIKPIDKKMIDFLVKQNYKIVTLEDNVLHGGLGSLILEYINVSHSTNKTAVLNIGFKDEFVTHGSVDILYKLYKMDPQGIIDQILKIL